MEKEKRKRGVRKKDTYKRYIGTCVFFYGKSIRKSVVAKSPSDAKSKLEKLKDCNIVHSISLDEAIVEER